MCQPKPSQRSTSGEHGFESSKTNQQSHYHAGCDSNSFLSESSIRTRPVFTASPPIIATAATAASASTTAPANTARRAFEADDVCAHTRTRHSQRYTVKAVVLGTHKHCVHVYPAHPSFQQLCSGCFDPGTSRTSHLPQPQSQRICDTAPGSRRSRPKGRAPGSRPAPCLLPQHSVVLFPGHDQPNLVLFIRT